jgi:hypothetical protein
MLDGRDAALLEAILDPRVGFAPGEADAAPLAALRAAGLLEPSSREKALAFLTETRRSRLVHWAARTLTQGEILDAFARHCADDLDEVDVVEAGPDALVARWRTEASRIELRAGFVGIERLASEEQPTMLLGPLGADADAIVAAFLDRPELRARLAACDLDRLERIGTPRSSVFVYLEWFLRAEYGVKLLPADAFTRGLIERGIISLGMG